MELSGCANTRNMTRVAEQNEDKYELINHQNVHELYFYLISLYKLETTRAPKTKYILA